MEATITRTVSATASATTMCVRTARASWTSPALLLLAAVVAVAVAGGEASEVLRPRGVSISKASLYVPDQDFVCFDRSATVPFTAVNDDYCDCADGSDEPGTAACPNGSFHCTNAGHKSVNIPSSRVNDGICDCCDTSDEYGSEASCVNNCNELGKAARVEAQKLAELTKLGSEMKVQLSRKGKQIRQEKQERLSQLEKDKEEAEKIKEEKELLKLSAEELESKALEKYKKVEEDEKQKQLEEQQNANEQEAFEFFHQMDSNQDGKLQMSELQARQTFDQNRDGEVSAEEAKFFLDEQEELSWEDYLLSGWPRMKPLLMLDKGLFQPPRDNPDEATASAPDRVEAVEQEQELSQEAEEEEEEEEGDDDDDQKEFETDPDEQDEDHHEEEEEDLEGGVPVEEENQEEKPKYDDETQALVDAANQARSEFEESDRAARDIQREIQNIKDSLEKDYGQEEEFAPLDGECFEYTDTEYVYKLCPFDQATQRSKSGGSDTRLGTWKSWAGPDENKYHVMLYDRGHSCWNGPQRSAHVKLSCGTQNTITSVSEPNRCEYLFEFVTPSVCQTVESSEPAHDEL